MMKQRCYLWAVWLTWLGLPALAVVLGLLQGWAAAVFMLLVGVVAQILYIRWFPRISLWMGYGSVADVPVEKVSMPDELHRVTLYTANVCPFCPIIRHRLTRLRQILDFEFEEVDVTFRPHIVLAKGVRSVPLIEANGRFLIGNATSEQLASFLKEATESQQTTG